MTALRPGRFLTLAIHPHSRGFGWVAFESPLTPCDWGLIEATKDKNNVCLRKAERLIDRLRPETLVLEAFERENSIRSDRITRLGRALVSLAQGRGVEVAVHSFAEVQSCFGATGARTRQEIAEAVLRQVDVFRHRLPPKRRAWSPEDKRIALFSAAALVLTHFRSSAEGLFDHLRDS